MGHTTDDQECPAAIENGVMPLGNAVRTEAAEKSRNGRAIDVDRRSIEGSNRQTASRESIHAISHRPPPSPGWYLRTKDGHRLYLRIDADRNGECTATVLESSGIFRKISALPVLCRRDLRRYLPRLMQQSNPGRWIRVVRAVGGTAVMVGPFGLSGGGDPSIGRRLERSFSSRLSKTLSESDIDSTASLVRELNADPPLTEKRLLLEWMQGYISWFSRQQTENLTAVLLKEYCLLGNVRSNDITTAECVHRWFCSLCNRIRQGSYGETALVDAIDTSLQIVDRRIFRDDPSLLIKLSDDLLTKLDPSTTAFTRETYPTQSPILFALYRTIVTMEQIAPEQLDPTPSDGLYQKFCRQLSVIVHRSQFYPFVYHCQLIRSGLHRLKTISKGIGRRNIATGAMGAMYIFRGLRSLLALDLDVESFEHGIDRLRSILIDFQNQKAPWYDCIQAFGRAALSTFVAPFSYDRFGMCYRTMKKEIDDLTRSESRTALRFGTILQLQSLAVHGVDDRIRNRAMQDLVELAEGCNTPDGWNVDPEVVEALLDALKTLQHCTPSQDIDVALEILVSIEQPSTREVVQTWLLGRSMDGTQRQQSLESGRLFGIVRKELLSAVSHASSPSYDRRCLRGMLEDFYQKPQFTKMEPLFEGEPALHVVSVQCQLMYLEQKEIKDNELEDEESMPSEEQEHHLCRHYERREWVKTVISQASLFCKRRLKPGVEESDIHRVLITGDPGTGKTTLARHLAFNWSTGEWGQEFHVVFFLQVRELQASKYNDTNTRREETLATAIVNGCLPRQDTDTFVELRRQVTVLLNDPRTLVILDGLDESAGASQVIIDEAKNGEHKLLMLSRPYGIQRDRSLADIEVTLSGLNDDQLEQRIASALPSDQARSLKDYLRTSPAVWNIAHIPVNATILCTLWRDPHLKIFERSGGSSLTVLYRRMTHFTWERYVLKTKQETEDVVEVFDTLGMIAYEALMQGQILIDAWLVQDHARTSQMKRILRETGFLLLKPIGMQYQFPHLTFQEYFAGRWLARQFCRGTTAEIASVEEILVHQKYDVELKMVFSFMIGEVSLMRGYKGAERMLEQIHREPKDVIGIQHLLLELRLLNDHLSASKLPTDRPKFDAVDRLIALMHGCAWEYTLASLLTEALKGLPSLVRCCPELLEPLMTMCEWSKRFRIMGMHALVHLLPYVPLQLASVIDFMESLFCRSDENLRGEIIGFVRRLLPAFSDRGDALMPLMKTACNDDHHSVRESAPMGIVALMPFVSKSDKAILIEKLRVGCDDELYTVRKSALVSIDVIVSREAQYISIFLDGIVKMLWDSYEYIREAATEVFEKIVLRSTEATGTIVERLKEAAGAAPGVAQYAFEAMGALLPLMPDLCPEFVETMSIGGYHWSSSVRESAIQTISKAIRLDPSTRPKLLPVIEHGLNADAYVVRKASIKSLGDVVEHCTPEDVRRIEHHLVDGFSDPEFLVRLTTVEAVGEVTKSMPDKIEIFLEALKSASKDDVSTVRKASIEVFGQIMSQGNADRTESLMQTLMDASNDAFIHVRKSALDCLTSILRRSPDELDRLVESLKGFKSRNAHGRKGAVDTVNELLRFAPERKNEWVELLMEAFDDDDHHVRTLTLQILGSVEDFPEFQISRLIGKLFEACMDDTPIVRNIAMDRTKAFLEKHPEVCCEIIEAVRTSTKDHHRPEYRRAGYLIMAEIVRHQPDVICVCIPSIRRGCRDEINFVREAALFVVRRVMEVDLGEFSKLTDLVFAAREGSSRVRAAAVKLIAVAMDVAPDVFDDFIDEALNGFYDRSIYVRKCAFQLADKVTMQRPNLIPEWLPLLVELFHDPSRKHQHISKESIQRIPLETLMECYWDAPWKRGLAFILVSRLYHVALTIKRSGKRYKLILHCQSARAIEWEKTEEETMEMVELLNETHDERMQFV